MDTSQGCNEDHSVTHKAVDWACYAAEHSKADLRPNSSAGRANPIPGVVLALLGTGAVAAKSAPLREHLAFTTGQQVYFRGTGRKYFRLYSELKAPQFCPAAPKQPRITARECFSMF